MFGRCESIKKQLLEVGSLYSMLVESLDDLDMEYIEGIHALKGSLAESIKGLEASIDELNDDPVTLYLKELRLLEIGRFREGLAAVKDHKGWYFIDVRGKAITKERFHNVLNFEDGKARVSKGDEGWYIDRTGRRTDFI